MSDPHVEAVVGMQQHTEGLPVDASRGSEPGVGRETAGPPAARSTSPTSSKGEGEPSGGEVTPLPESAAASSPASSSDVPVDAARLEQEGEVAADYLEGLLDIADLDGDIDMDVEGERAVVSIVATESEGTPAADLTRLIGPQGEVLDALQELTRLAVHQALGTRSRLLLDVGSYRARKRQELSEMGRDAAQRAASTHEPVRLRAMTPFERKVIHDAVAAAGQRSESEGVEPERFVVVLPA